MITNGSCSSKEEEKYSLADFATVDRLWLLVGCPLVSVLAGIDAKFAIGYASCSFRFSVGDRELAASWAMHWVSFSIWAWVSWYVVSLVLEFTSSDLEFLVHSRS